MGVVHMAKFFRALGLVMIAISVLTLIFVLASGEFVIGLAVAFSGAVVGVLLHTVGELLDRVSYLEDKLGMHLTLDEGEDLPQHQCTNCKKDYDMDYPKCPYCGAENELLEK